MSLSSAPLFGAIARRLGSPRQPVTSSSWPRGVREVNGSRYRTGWWLVIEIRLKAFIVIATHATAL